MSVVDICDLLELLAEHGPIDIDSITASYHGFPESHGREPGRASVQSSAVADVYKRLLLLEKRQMVERFDDEDRGVLWRIPPYPEKHDERES